MEREPMANEQALADHSRTTRRKERDVYVAIMVASARGTGVNLTWAECSELSLDDAVATRAANALEAPEYGGGFGPGEEGWAKIDPYRSRVPANLSCTPIDEHPRNGIEAFGGDALAAPSRSDESPVGCKPMRPKTVSIDTRDKERLR
jgi:hypothetical protein